MRTTALLAKESGLDDQRSPFLIDCGHTNKEEYFSSSVYSKNAQNILC